MKFTSRAQYEYIKEYFPKVYEKSIREHGVSYIKSLPLIEKKDYKFIKSMVASGPNSFPILKSKG